MCARNERSSRCSASSSKAESETAAGGKSGHRRSSSRPRSSSRQRSSSRSGRSVQHRESTADDSNDDRRRRSRSLSTRRTSKAPAPPPKKEYDTPFDSKGRCHHHPNTQLARKKLTGGWKVLIDNCPKCLEDKHITKSSDNRSVCSRRSRSRSARGNGERSKSPRRVSDHKRSSRSVTRGGGGCDNRSVSSRRSNRSSRSSRSVPGGIKILPFDDKGYCHRHPNVRLAKRKFTGGWKILLDRCNECVANEKDSKSVCSKSSRRSRSKSVCSKSSRHDRHRQSCRLSDASSDVEDMSTSNSNNHRKKKSARKMSYTDDTGKEGFYTGYVNDHYKPHGRGKIVYQDGTKYSGTWMEGSKVHGKTTDTAKGGTKKHRSRKDMPKKEGPKESVKHVSKSKGEFEDSADFERQWENERRKAKHCKKVDQGKDRHGTMEEYANLHYTSAKVVKDLPFVDLSGDAGKYTGEVNDKLLPHGKGCLTYHHGLVQEGKWTNGFIDDDSTAVC